MEKIAPFKQKGWCKKNSEKRLNLVHGKVSFFSYLTFLLMTALYLVTLGTKIRRNLPFYLIYLVIV